MDSFHSSGIKQLARAYYFELLTRSSACSCWPLLLLLLPLLLPRMIFRRRRASTAISALWLRVRRGSLRRKLRYAAFFLSAASSAPLNAPSLSWSFHSFFCMIRLPRCLRRDSADESCIVNGTQFGSVVFCPL